MRSNKKNKQEETRSSSNSINVIGVGTSIEGNVKSNGDVRIDGTLTGSVETASKLVLGNSGKIIGNVKAKSADISGTIEGDLSVGEILFLKSSSKVHGDIRTDKLVVESGSEFNGKCEMGKQTISMDSAKAAKQNQAVGQ